MDSIVDYSRNQSRNRRKIASMTDNAEKPSASTEATSYPDMTVAYFAYNHKWNRSLYDIVASWSICWLFQFRYSPISTKLLIQIPMIFTILTRSDATSGTLDRRE